MEKPQKRYLRVLGRAPRSFAYELHVQFPSALRAEGWTPAINVFGCRQQIVVCVELAGVEKGSIKIEAQSRRLLIRGYRGAAEPQDCEGPLMQVLALEIDHGPFEREIELPASVEPEGVRADHRNGLLWIHLPLREESGSL